MDGIPKEEKRVRFSNQVTKHYVPYEDRVGTYIQDAARERRQQEQEFNRLFQELLRICQSKETNLD